MKKNMSKEGETSIPTQKMIFETATEIYELCKEWGIDPIWFFDCVKERFITLERLAAATSTKSSQPPLFATAPQQQEERYRDPFAHP